MRKAAKRKAAKLKAKRKAKKRKLQRKRKRRKKRKGLRAPSGGCARPVGYPATFHSEAPRGDDVSRAFIDGHGCKHVLNAVNIFPGWNADHYTSIRAKGFNAVRLLVKWASHEPAPGEIDLGDIDTAVANARAAGLYVIIDTFLTDHWNRPPPWTNKGRPSGCVNWESSDQIDYIHTDGKGFLQAIVRRYKDNPTVAAYDLVGEPHGSQDQGCLLGFYSDLIDWAREIDSEKVVVLEPGWGNGDPSLADVAMLRQRRNVAWSWHDYYAGDGNSGTVFAGYNQWQMNGGNQISEGGSHYPNPGDIADFEAQVLVHVKFAKRAGIALMGAGEYGINPHVANAAAWMDQKTFLYRKYGLSRAWWLYTCGESFGLKDEACNWRYAADHLGVGG